MEYDENALQTVRETRLLLDEYDAWLFDEFKAYLGRRIIEIGCGMGNQLTHLLDREFIVGIDPSETTISQVQERFAGHSNFRAFAQSITDTQVLSLAPLGFDTAFSLNVFEHIENDNCALANTFALLQSNGILILIVPAHGWLYGTMDRSIGHYRRYTANALGEKMERAGFRVIRQKYLNMLGGVGWLLNGRILGHQVPPTGQLKLVNSLVPILRSIESRITPPFGISLLSIAVKPGD